MVARTPQKLMRKVAMVAPPLNSILLKETINKVDKCMERLQELQYTVAGGTKVVSGVSLSPRSTKTYLKTSLGSKQETLRIKNATNRRSPVGKFPASSQGDWRKMSLPAMLLGETINEILRTTQVTRDIVEAIDPKNNHSMQRESCPKTPNTQRKASKSKAETVSSDIRARRKKEKQNRLKHMRTESDSASLQRARSRIAFKVVSPQEIAEKGGENGNGSNSLGYWTNRVSPMHRPWVKKTVLFPNPLFIPASSTQQAKFRRTGSPVISSNKNSRQTPHKFLIKSPHTSSASKFQVKIKSPPKVASISLPRRNGTLVKKSPKDSISPLKATISPAKRRKLSTAAKLRRSFSPSRLASRLVSPLISRKSTGKIDDMMILSRLEQRPVLVPKDSRRGNFDQENSLTFGCM